MATELATDDVLDVVPAGRLMTGTAEPLLDDSALLLLVTEDLVPTDAVCLPMLWDLEKPGLLCLPTVEAREAP